MLPKTQALSDTLLYSNIEYIPSSTLLAGRHTLLSVHWDWQIDRAYWQPAQNRADVGAEFPVSHHYHNLFIHWNVYWSS